MPLTTTVIGLKLNRIQEMRQAFPEDRLLEDAGEYIELFKTTSSLWERFDIYADSEEIERLCQKTLRRLRLIRETAVQL